MLNFAEQTGSGAVIVVWSFLSFRGPLCYITGCTWQIPSKSTAIATLSTFIQPNTLTSYTCKTHTTPHHTTPHHILCPLWMIFVIILYSIPSKTDNCSLLQPKHLAIPHTNSYCFYVHKDSLALSWSQTSQKSIQIHQNKHLSWEKGQSKRMLFKNPFKNGQLFTIVTQTSLNLHQFTLILYT